MRASHAEPSAPPSGTATQSTGTCAASATACTHSSTRIPPPVATSRRGVDTGMLASGVERRGARRSPRPRRQRGGPRAASWVRSRSTSTTAARRVVERRALASRVRSPHRHAARLGRGRPAARASRVTQLQNSPPALRGPPTSNLPWRGVRDRPEPGHRDVARADDPHDQRRPEDHEHVAFVVGAGDDLLRERVDAARRERWSVAVDAVRPPSRSGTRRGSCSGRTPAVGRDRPRPSPSSRTAGTPSPRSRCRARPRPTTRGSRPPARARSRPRPAPRARTSARKPSSSPLSAGLPLASTGSRPRPRSSP